MKKFIKSNKKEIVATAAALIMPGGFIYLGYKLLKFLKKKLK